MLAYIACIYQTFNLAILNFFFILRAICIEYLLHILSQHHRRPFHTQYLRRTVFQLYSPPIHVNCPNSILQWIIYITSNRFNASLSHIDSVLFTPNSWNQSASHSESITRTSPPVRVMYLREIMSQSHLTSVHVQ